MSNLNLTLHLNIFHWQLFKNILLNRKSDTKMVIKHVILTLETCTGYKENNKMKYISTNWKLASRNID